jgi:hypothetical protein
MDTPLDRVLVRRQWRAFFDFGRKSHSPAVTFLLDIVSE